MINLLKLIGALGVVFIIIGLLIKSKRRDIRDVLYIFGGVSLAAYSIYIRDAIFIPLQVIFTLVAVYDFIKIRK